MPKYDFLKSTYHDQNDFDLNQVQKDEERVLNTLGAALKKRRRRRRHRGFRGFPRNKLRVASALIQSLPPGRRKEALSKLRKARYLRRFGAKKLAQLQKIKKLVASSPKTKKKLALQLLKRGLRKATDDATESPTSVNSVTQIEKPSANPVADPVQPAVDDDHTPATPSEEVENMEDNAAENAYEKEQGDEAAAEEDGEEEAAESNDDTAEELTEPSDEEEAEEESAAGSYYGTQSGAGDYYGSQSGAPLYANDTGEMLGKMKKAAKVAHRTKVRTAAHPIAKTIERKSGGKVKAKKTMQGCKLIQAAKGGNKQAKASILALQLAAKKGDKKAKKAVLQLKLCGKVLKKARKVVAKKASRGKAGPGLNSTSATQRGYAMIPTTFKRLFPWG